MARDFSFADVLSDGPVYTDSRGRSRFRSSSFDPSGGQRQQQQMGFTRGFSLGEEAGWKDGYNLGLQRGAQLASELGFYQGFVHAWITVLEREETVKQRKLTALKTLLDMTRSFPRGSMYDDDIMEKLQKIRAKFKQVVALLNVSTEYTAPEEPVNQRTEMSF